MTQTFIGRLTKDIEEIKTGIHTFTLAYNPPVKDPDAIFIQCVMFSDVSNMHKNILQYLKKGSLMVVSGAISKVNTYVSKDNKPKATISFTVFNLQFVPKTKSSESTEESIINRMVQ